MSKEKEEAIQSCLRYINDNPSLLSLLYDLDLLPEQLKRDTKEFSNMLRIAYHFMQFENEITDRRKEIPYGNPLSYLSNKAQDELIDILKRLKETGVEVIKDESDK